MTDTLVKRKNGNGHERTDLIRVQKCSQCEQAVIIRCSLRGVPLRKHSGLCRSCSRKTGNLAGQKFLMLFVLGEDKAYKNLRMWRVRCDCGKETIVHQYNLGRTKSCGCLSKHPDGVAARNRVMHTYRSNAKRLSRTWALTENQFDLLVKSDCHYCGDPPASLSKASGGDFVYNGIDRKDNGVGYTWGNAVPCCSTCNYLKRTMPYEEFVAFLKKAGRHQLEALCTTAVIA